MSQELISFKEIESTDLPDAALLIERANAQRDGQPLVHSLTNSSGIDSLATKLGKPEAWGELALIEDRTAGVILGYPAAEATDLPTDYSDADYISLLMVEPIHWGKRIASMLLDRAAEQARNTNRPQLILLTRKDANEHAQSVYEHKGYVKTKHRRPSKYGEQILYLLNLE